MKKRSLFCFLVIISVFLHSCIDFNDGITGNGNVITEIHEVGNFNGIEAGSGLNVYVEFGEMSNEVEVIADENLHEYISVEVNNGILKIKSRKNIRRATSRDVFVNAGMINRVGVSSAADLVGENILNTEDIDINVSSAGDLDLEFNAESIRVDISSSGSAHLKGEGRKLDVNVSSAGDLDAYDLIVEEADIDVSSAGDARVHVTKKIRASASSAGSIRYDGNPEEKKVSTSSAGSISGR